MRIWKPWRPNKEKVIDDESLGISFCAEMNPDQKTFPSLHFQQKEICIKYNARQNRDAAKSVPSFLRGECGKNPLYYFFSYLDSVNGCSFNTNAGFLQNSLV